MITTAVQDEKNRLRCVMHQALQKLDKHSSVDSALGQHEAHVSARADRGNHVDGTPLPRRPHHRRLSLDAPCRPRMMVRSHPGFVAKVDVGPDCASLPADQRVLLLRPPPPSLRVLLHRPTEGPVAAQPELLQQPPPTGHAQPQVEFLSQQNPDHLPSPERKLEAELQRTLTRDRSIEPSHLSGLDLHRPTLQGSGFQCTPTPAAVPGQPGVNAASRKPHRLDHRFWALPPLTPPHPPNSTPFQRLVLEPTPLPSPHAGHYTLCLLTYEYINISIQ